MNCWLAKFSEAPCEGRIIRAHLLPAHVIRREFPKGAYLDRTGHWQPIGSRVDAPALADVRSTNALIWDSRAWVPACGGITGGPGGHHGAMDYSRKLRVPYDDLPGGLIAYAEELRLGWFLEREYQGWSHFILPGRRTTAQVPQDQPNQEDE